jgi:hypothetical protein
MQTVVLKTDGDIFISDNDLNSTVDIFLPLIMQM